MRTVRFGVLSTAKIGRTKVIPAMQQGEHTEIAAICSRSLDSARRVADELGIATAHGSYEALLADPDVEAVYIPLPNHLHVEWAIKSLEAGKHVLCEKPIGLDSAQARLLMDAASRQPDRKIMEGFMYRHHPQWIEAKRLATSGDIGEVRAIRSVFAYHNDDPGNIRNRADIGGGGLMDIGCYAISLSRWLFDAEPDRVCGFADRDPNFGTDRLFSGMMEFSGNLSSFTCSTQLAPSQRVEILGSAGRMEIPIPFNAPPDEPCSLILQRGKECETLTFPPCDQYTAQGDRFARAILDDAPVPTPLDDALANMLVLERLQRSANTGNWE